MKYFLLFVLLSTASKFSFAQVSNNQISKSNYEQQTQKETDQMHTLLKLKKDQLDSVTVINRDYYYQIAFLQNFKLNLSVRNNKLIDIENSWKSRLDKNLTIGQYKQYFDKKTEKKIKWQQRQDSLRSKHR